MRDLAAAIRDIPMPRGIEALPRQRGFPVPWFVALIDGEYDFRVVGPTKLFEAVKGHLCWLCGLPLGRMRASVIGPMCLANRVTSEPPCHPVCAHYAVQACPFLSQPRARRNERDLPEDRTTPGFAIDRNPGVTVIWNSLADSKPFRPSHGNDGVLFDLTRPHRIEWWTCGRLATRQECEDALATGLPALADMAALEGSAAELELTAAMIRARQLLPA